MPAYIPAEEALPATFPLAAFFFGAILVLIAIVGGNIEVAGVKISATNAGKAGRFIAGVLGVSLIVLSFWLYLLPPPPPASPTSMTGTPTPIFTPTSAPPPLSPPPVSPTPELSTSALLTNTPRPTSTPTATPVPISCYTAIGPHLQEAKPKIAPSACPKGTEQSVVNYAIQQFEHGWMLEPFLDRHDVYVLFESPKKTWKPFQEDWEAGGPSDYCKDIPEKPGNYKKPIYSLSQVWCGRSPNGGLTPDDRQSIGYGNYAGFSNPPMLYFQELDDNTIMFGGAPLAVNQYVSNVSGTVIFILFSDHSWYIVGGVP